ncbi:MAG TPA: hypothetical protein VNO30_11110 [Kofleriaceae bacterium]|nr:hypothetical protein [Kofleriaceae bacterium]
MRSWNVIPAMALGAPVAALALGAAPLPAALAAGAGAGLAAAVRALAGESPAGLAAAVIAPLLAVASIVERGGSLAAPCLALASIGWVVAELARPATRPLVALAPATLAAILAPAAAPLIALAGARLVLEPGPAPRPRWLVAVPLVGALAVVLALGIGLTHGSFAALWFGEAAQPSAPGAPGSPLWLAARAADALGPIAAIAALGGLAALARPPRGGRLYLPELAAGACIAGAFLADLRAGAIGPLTLGLGALAAGLGAARFAGQIRLPAGQAITAATVGLLLLLPPAWTAAARRAHEMESGPAPR